MENQWEFDWQWWSVSEIPLLATLVVWWYPSPSQFGHFQFPLLLRVEHHQDDNHSIHLSQKKEIFFSFHKKWPNKPCHKSLIIRLIPNTFQDWDARCKGPFKTCFKTLSSGLMRNFKMKESLVFIPAKSACIKSWVLIDCDGCIWNCWGVPHSSPNCLDPDIGLLLLSMAHPSIQTAT